MTTIKTFIKRRPVLSYYVIVFVNSWGGFLLAVGPTTAMAVVDIPPGAILAMMAGPVVGGAAPPRPMP